MINSLRPFIPVVIVGDRTYGKPVGQYAIPFCDKILAPVSFQLRNANGEGDFFDGLPADCAAPDDLDHPIGDAMEGSLREALTVISTGACSAPSAATDARPAPARQPGHPADGLGCGARRALSAPVQSSVFSLRSIVLEVRNGIRGDALLHP